MSLLKEKDFNRECLKKYFYQFYSIYTLIIWQDVLPNFNILNILLIYFSLFGSKLDIMIDKKFS